MQFESPESPSVTPSQDESRLAERRHRILERSKPFYKRLMERVASNRLAKAVVGIAMLTATEAHAQSHDTSPTTISPTLSGYVQTDWPAHTMAQGREMKETVDASRAVEHVPLKHASTGEIIERDDGSYSMAVHVWVEDGEKPEDHKNEAFSYVKKELPLHGVKTADMKLSETKDPIVDKYGPRMNYRGLTIGSVEDVEFVRAIPRQTVEDIRTSEPDFDVETYEPGLTDEKREGTEYVFAVPVEVKGSGTSLDKPITMQSPKPVMDYDVKPAKSKLTEKQKKYMQELFNQMDARK